MSRKFPRNPLLSQSRFRTIDPFDSSSFCIPIAAATSFADLPVELTVERVDSCNFVVGILVMPTLGKREKNEERRETRM